MTRFLHRPMFRTGGSAGLGITSGLSTPKRGLVNEPGGYAGKTLEEMGVPRNFINANSHLSDTEILREWSKKRQQLDEPNFSGGNQSNNSGNAGAMDWAKIWQGLPDAWSTYSKQLGDYPKSQARSDFLINFGLDLASRSPSGNIIQTAAESAKEPFKIMQQQTAYDKASERQEKKDFMDTYMSSMSEILGGEAAASIFKDEKMAQLGKETLKSMWAHNEKFDSSWTADDPEYQDWVREKRLIDSDFDNFEKESGLDMKDIMGGTEGITNLQEGFAKSLKTSEKIIKHPVTGEEIEESEFYNDPENRGYLQEKVIEMTFEFMKRKQNERRGWKTLKAEGGRAGYQAGNLVEQMDVDVMTPKGDMAMQETVEEGVMPDQLSYEELRSRLPVEITDDIVRLLVSSASALGDFAQIQTQQDVDNFNAKYGVNLVLPSEA